MNKDRAELFKAKPETAKRISKALDDYREAVRQDFERPVFLPKHCSCCPIHQWPIY